MASLLNLSGGSLLSKGLPYDIVQVIPKIIPNSYIKTDGTQVAYNTWKSTDFIPVSGYSYYFSNVENIRYGAFYDANKNKVASSSNTYIIPTNAVYFRISDKNSKDIKVVLSNSVQNVGIYQTDCFVSTSGIIKPYSGWSTYKISIYDDVYAVPCITSVYEDIYSASYNQDESVREIGKFIYHKPLNVYVLASKQTSNNLRFLYGKNYGIIDYN